MSLWITTVVARPDKHPKIRTLSDKETKKKKNSVRRYHPCKTSTCSKSQRAKSTCLAPPLRYHLIKLARTNRVAVNDTVNLLLLSLSLLLSSFAAAVTAGPPPSREITEPGWRSQREERVPRPIYQAVILSPERETSTNEAAHQWSACVITGRYEVGARVDLNSH